MKLNKILKLGGTMALTTASILAPIATTISCGSSSSSDLTVGIRPEDQPLWNKVAEEFKLATGKTVKFKWVTDQNNDYTLWSGSDLMPDVTIADTGWAKTGHDKQWFDQIDVNDIVTNQNYIISGQSDAYAEDTELKYDGDHFETAMMETMKTDGDKFNGLSVIYGPKLTYAWKKIPQGDGYFHIINDDDVTSLSTGDTGERTDLEYYVPDGEGHVVKAVDASSEPTDATSPSNLLYSLKSDHHRLQTTQNDIQEFLTRSAAQEDVKFNGDIKTNGLTKDSFSNVTENSDIAKKLIISTGIKGYMQRLASVSKVLFDKIHNFENPFKTKLKVGAVEDSALNWGSLAYGNSLQGSHAASGTEAELKGDWNLNSNNVLLDDNVFTSENDATKINVTNKSLDIDSLSSMDMNEYAASLGYFTAGVFGNSAVDPNKGDRQNLFGQGQSLFLGDGALWQWEGIGSKVTDTFKGANPDELLTSFGQPYQITGVDGYALKQGLTGDHELLAKKFLRFLMQKQVAADISGNKAISTVKAAQPLQPKLTGPRKTGLESSGTSLFSSYLKDLAKPINLPTVLAKSSTTDGKEVNGVDTSPIYDPYNDFLMKASDTAWGINKPTGGVNPGLTLVQYAGARKAFNIKYAETLEVH